MTTLLRVDASIRVEGSVSRALADRAEAAWQAEHPDGTIVRRDLGRRPIPADVWPALIGDVIRQAAGAEAPAAGSADAETLARAEAVAAELLAEFRAADAYLLAVPMYNWGVAQHLKTYLDVLLTDRELHGGGPVAGRPAILTLSRGGSYAPGSPKEGWDHATPYLRQVFGEVFRLRLHVAEAELTLASVTPGMEGLVDAAIASERNALDDAQTLATDAARTLHPTAA